LIKMERTRLIYLHQRYLDKTASPDEIQEFQIALGNPEVEAVLKSLADNNWEIAGNEQRAQPQNYELIYRSIINSPQERKGSFRLWPLIAVVAAVVVMVFGAGLFYFNQRTKRDQHTVMYANDIKPGGNKAVLTLSNGKQIVLNDAKNGTLVKDNNTIIHKTAEGKVAYESSGSNNSIIEYNTMVTPRGGQYQVNLSDGTSVWLNAASSLKYPTQFKGAERMVELTGEAYFIVKHNEKQPFKIKTKGQVIEDIGTEFNVNAYANEPVSKTTLVEGIIAVNKTVLKPGEQSIFNGNSLQVVSANVQLETAWKNNKFRFESESIASVMRMVERWYDVEVEYVGQIPDDKFGGRVSRYDNVSKVLEKLESTGSVHFKIKGRKITVTK
jgi:transmembrane sensor